MGWLQLEPFAAVINITVWKASVFVIASYFFLVYYEQARLGAYLSILHCQASTMLGYI
jgi:hypothetical protein